jgi:hypothetical protein
MVAKTTRQQTKLMQEKAHLQGLIARSEARIAQIDEELAALDLAETVQDVRAAPAQAGPRLNSNGGKGGAGWIETRMIGQSGPYAYRRWWENGKKRSEYLGKVMTR